jgi:hypothetical protein
LQHCQFDGNSFNRLVSVVIFSEVSPNWSRKNASVMCGDTPSVRPIEPIADQFRLEQVHQLDLITLARRAEY